MHKSQYIDIISRFISQFGSVYLNCTRIKAIVISRNVTLVAYLYLKGLRHAAELRRQLNTLKHYDEIAALFTKYLSQDQL